MTHFSKYIRPGAEVIGVENNNKELQITAAQNPDGTIAVIVFNEGETEQNFNLTLNKKSIDIHINDQALQTIIIPTN